MLVEFLDIDDNINISFYIKAVEQTEAIKMAKRKNTDIDKMKIEENKKAVRSGYDMDILPSDLITYGDNIKLLLKDLQTRDERMFVVTIVFMNFARTLQKLDSTLSQISSIASRHIFRMKRMKLRWRVTVRTALLRVRHSSFTDNFRNFKGSAGDKFVEIKFGRDLLNRRLINSKRLVFRRN